VSAIETPSVGTASGDLTFTVEATMVDQLSSEPFDRAKIDIEGVIVTHWDELPVVPIIVGKPGIGAKAPVG